VLFIGVHVVQQTAADEGAGLLAHVDIARRIKIEVAQVGVQETPVWESGEPRIGRGAKGAYSSVCAQRRELGALPWLCAGWSPVHRRVAAWVSRTQRSRWEPTEMKER
jgi:hypothetical protein